MASEPLPAGYLEAGQEFDKALRHLGFYPDALLWAVDKSIEDFVLVLITRHFDYAGPTEIFRLLTRAYNLSATPREISPFIIRLHSANQEVAQQVQMVQGDIRKADGRRSETAWLIFEVADLKFQSNWVYYANAGRKLDAVSRSRQWQRFRKNIEKLAA